MSMKPSLSRSKILKASFKSASCDKEMEIGFEPLGYKLDFYIGHHLTEKDVCKTLLTNSYR